jgi:hypothetical protein
MSLKVIRRILESPGCAKGAAWALLVAMANRADDDGTGMWESMGNLAKTGGIDRATAFRALPELLASGVVVDTGEKHSSRRGGVATRIYRIDLDKLSAPTSQDETVDSRKERPSQDATVAGCNVPTSQDATQTSPYPVQDIRIDRDQVQSQVPIRQETEAQPKLVPVSYLPPDSTIPCEPEVEKLVGMFLNYQGNPGNNKKDTLLHWHSVLSRLRRTYPSLADYMGFAFKSDPFWSSGKLIRGKNSKGKGGKLYPDLIDYFEDMLGYIVTNFNRQQKGMAAASKRSARQPGGAVAESVELWDQYRVSRESQVSMERARAYFASHRKEYEEQHPEWLEDFKFRRIYE